MEITIKILGENLFSAIKASKPALDATFFKLSRHADPVTITVEKINEPLSVQDLLADPQNPSVILAHTDNTFFLDRLQTMEKRDALLAGSSDSSPLVAPIIMAFSPGSPMNELREFPDMVSDWFFMPVAAPELARRVLYALRRKCILKSRLCFGPMTLIPDSRTLMFATRSTVLTRSEFALAELFLAQLGSVIPTSDLVALFKSTGKSTEGSNIRVTIFQLRLKLEMLTKSQYTLASVYKQGYCMKQKPRPTVVEDYALRSGRPTPGEYRIAATLQ
ncbi:winged helix-turn-helix domain-containing protein [Lacisediminimonas sp.]|uniref:winged helix-turn-helix domain-containing protein n=1 Tax=Lacisediminimonas sp. TaxID=3060582 RepID=UPI00271937E8|nr:winged helix-turn-helix domain-containing protein [Lacisediminimonas sp.]MDO8299502.1 winged helix-turn-helix domain-containing protein [Lacisediminimonas sp.]